MKISLDWISEFVKITLPPEKLAVKIAEHCFEVEKILNVSGNSFGFSNVFTAKVLEYEKHPNADRLRVVKLDLGGKVIEPVVCGANNFEAGDVVALALPGARIPQNVHTGEKEAFELGKAKIRGVESQGMICSAFELGLADVPEEKPEILIFEKGTESGLALEDLLSKGREYKGSVVFEVSLPANRPDLHSHFGIARELANILGLETTKTFGEIEKKYSKKMKSSKGIFIEIKDAEHCLVYSAAHLKVKVGESPEFIKQRLQALGMRSINNVVDITNYVMLEMGQPLHAFDAKTVEGNSIVIRSAKADEIIETLDHKQKKLEAGMLLIADSKKPLAIAGIMGGANSEVSDTTSEIILESANFEQFNIRKTSKLLNLRTEASALWEKGVHPRLSLLGLSRAFELLAEHASAEVIAFGEAGKIDSKEKVIKFTAEGINNILGTNISANEIKKYLKQAGMEVSASAAKIPYNRTDMENYADLADEVARIIGMNNIERKPLNIQRSVEPRDMSADIFDLKQFMASAGFNELQTYSFISEQDIQKYGEEKVDSHLKVKNPLSADQGYLKKDLLIPVLKNIQNNLRYADAMEVFEIGKKYLGYMNEPESLIFAVTHKNKTVESLLARVKGVVDALFAKYSNIVISAKDKGPGLLSLWIENEEIGELGMVKSTIALNFEIEQPVAYSQIDIAKLFKVFSSQQKKFVPYSRFQDKILDISLVVSENVLWQDILDVVLANGTTLLKEVQLFEAPSFYAPAKLPRFHRELVEKGLKNLAFHMVFQSEKETLKDSEILPIYVKIQEELKAKLKAEIR